MLEVAARAPKGVITIPSRKLVRIEILNLFCEFMTDLKKKLEVSYQLINHIVKD
jgi:hypothetical protein